MTLHSSLTGSELHEPKGADSASIRDSYVSDGAGSGSWLQPVLMGWWKYDDNTTTSTPIDMTSTGTQYELTNDGAGSATDISHALTGITNIWNTGTSRFDFSGLSLGDTVDISVDLDWVTGGVNSDVMLFIELGVGGTPYQLPIIAEHNYKAAGTYNQRGFISFPIFDTNTRSNPARLLGESSASGDDMTINNFFIRTITRGES